MKVLLLITAFISITSLAQSNLGTSPSTFGGPSSTLNQASPTGFDSSMNSNPSTNNNGTLKSVPNSLNKQQREEYTPSAFPSSPSSITPTNSAPSGVSSPATSTP